MSTPINDGGPAFPYFNPDTEVVYPGMSLRDWFAGQAMQALIQRDADDSTYGDDMAKARPVLAYAYADAMLAERNTNTHDQ